MNTTWKYAELSFGSVDAAEYELTFSHADSVMPRSDNARLAIAALGDGRWEMVTPVVLDDGVTRLWFKRARFTS